VEHDYDGNPDEKGKPEPASGQEGSVEHDYDGNAPRDHNEQGDRQLHAAGYGDTGIFLQERGRQWTGCDTREHRKPAVRDG